jgi:predicted P-loop ATPase
MLINLDELENLNRSEIGSLKEIITKTHIRMRKAYGHNNENMPRRASFAGSVNTSQFLNDTTGSRRFLCFEVEHIEYTHDIDINKVYAQAFSLFSNGFRHWFNQEEIKEINANNEQYQLKSPEEELLLTWFEPAEKSKAQYFFSTTQIAQILSNRANININDATIRKLGMALKKHNFNKIVKNKIYVYPVNLFEYEEVAKDNKDSGEPKQEAPTQEKIPFRFEK